MARRRRGGPDGRDTTTMAPSGLRMKIKVGNRIEALETVCEKIEAFAVAAELTDADRRTLLLVIDELFSNIVEHGYVSNVRDDITISVVRGDRELAVAISDDARPFDGRPPPPPNEALAERKVGGVGLLLVHHFARDLTVSHNGNSNLTRFTLPLGEDRLTALKKSRP